MIYGQWLDYKQMDLYEIIAPNGRLGQILGFFTQTILGIKGKKGAQYP